jgi:predicted ATPase
MTSFKEKLPRRWRETLVFKTPEEAQEFAERVEGKLEQEQGEEVKQGREIVREELGRVMEAAGEGSAALRQPWQHSAEEHMEAQQLVEVAFEDDLLAALKRAQKSANYPRNIDLLHDILTEQLYEAVARRRLNKVSLKKWSWAAAGMAAVAAMVIFYYWLG